MTTIGLIGSGNIGSTVARLAVDAGHDVVLSNSRGPETLADLVDELGPHARAATAAEAAAAGDIVVVTVPLKAYREVPVEPLRGKVVIDTNNYYPQRDGHIAELDDESTTVSELLQAHLPESRVVKAFNNIYFEPPRHAAASVRRPGALGARRSPATTTTAKKAVTAVPRRPRLRRLRRRSARRRAGATSATPRRTPASTPPADEWPGDGRQVTARPAEGEAGRGGALPRPVIGQG